jgi:putative MATE family efflux protein
MTQAPDTPTAPATRAIFAMAWPLALKAAMLHGVIVIDAYLVSPLGEEALAAMGLAGALAGLLLGILFAFSTATQIRIAQAFGSSGPVALKTGFYAGLAVNLISTGVGLAIVIPFGPGILATFAHSDWIAEQANAYMAVFLLVILGEAVGQCLTSHFNGCGRTRITFWSYLLALPINVGVSLVLIHGLYGLPALGVVGAAWGTVLGALARVLFLAAVFWRETRGYVDTPGWSRGSFAEALRRHLVFSWPIAATFISMTVGNQVCVLIYAGMSVNDFAALTVINPWVQVLGTFGMSWAQATGICVAQLLGRGAPDAVVDDFLGRAWRMAFVASALVASAYLIFCLAAGRIYDELEAETTAALFGFLPILVLLPFPKGSNAICGQTLRAAGDTVYVMNVFIAGQWAFKVPLTLLFVQLGLPVFWVFSIVLLEELFKFPPFHSRLLRGAWKRTPDLLI